MFKWLKRFKSCSLIELRRFEGSKEFKGFKFEHLNI